MEKNNKETSKNEFIPYQNFGLDTLQNLILSFFTMYSKTHVSNEYLVKRTCISLSQVKRIIKNLSVYELIEIKHINKRRRTIELNPVNLDLLVKDRNTYLSRFNLSSDGLTTSLTKAHQEPKDRLTTSPSRLTTSLSRLTRSLYNKDKETSNKPLYNKVDKKLDNKENSNNLSVQSIIEELINQSKQTNEIN